MKAIIKDQLLDLANKNKLQFDCLYTDDKDFSASYQQQELDKFNFSNSQALSVRVIDGKHEGFAYTEDLSSESIKTTFDEAKENAKWVTKDQEVILTSNTKYENMDFLIDNASQELSTETKLEAALTLEKTALETDKKIQSVPYNGYSDSIGSRFYFNSNGASGSYQSSMVFLYAYCLAKQDDDAQMEGEYYVGRNFDPTAAKQLGEIAAKKALARLGAQVPKTGRYNAVFSNKAAQAFFDLVIPLLSAKLIDEGSSFFNGKLNEQIGSSVLSISDDPLSKIGYHSRPFDDEGSASQKTNLIENGKLNTFFSNLYYSKKLGLKNTAHASRSIKGGLSISPTNILVQSGKKSFNDLISQETETLVVTSFSGTAGFNGVSGQFSIESEGDLYRNGEKVHSLKNFVVSGHVFDILKNITEVGNDLLINANASITPSFSVTDLSIAGK